MRNINNFKIIGLLLSTGLLTACAGTPPTFVDPPQTLSPCPSSPNCVSSTAENHDSHYIAPISSNLTLKQKHQRLSDILSKQGNAKITKTDTHYIRAEFTSSFWGFVDDVEFILTDTQILLRSSSRLGYSDFGANRKRLEALRLQF